MWRPSLQATARRILLAIVAANFFAFDLRALSAAEYANLPISSSELRRAVTRSDLIARAHITAYQPPSVHSGIGTAEHVTLIIDEVYSGKLAPHTVLSYDCLCHMAEPPSATSLVGHEVIALLRYDTKQKIWSPALQPSPTYYSASLRDRILRLVKGHP